MTAGYHLKNEKFKIEITGDLRGHEPLMGLFKHLHDGSLETSQFNEIISLEERRINDLHIPILVKLSLNTRSDMIDHEGIRFKVFL